MSTPKLTSPSIADVARVAGVSVGSASRVVNQVPGVRDATRDKVLAAIAQLGYRPNHAAQSLRSRSTRTIGCLVTDVANPLYAQLFRALEERFLAEGYLLLLANGLNDPAREIALLQRFQDRGMDGVLIAPGNERNAEVLAAVDALTMPAVILDRDIAGRHDQLRFGHAAGLKNVVGHLTALGHRRISLVQTRSPNRPMRRRIEGFRDGLRQQGIAAGDHDVVQVDGTSGSAFAAVTALLAMKPRPTALVVQGTAVLAETLNAVHAAGLRLPDDLSLVSLGDPDFARGHVPPVSVLRVDLPRAADAAARLLLARLAGRAGTAAETARVATDFIDRGTCGPAPRR